MFSEIPDKFCVNLEHRCARKLVLGELRLPIRLRKADAGKITCPHEEYCAE